VGSSKIVETTLATSLAEIGEVRAEPNGNLIVPSLAIDEAVMLEKKGSKKIVDLTCATGTRPVKDLLAEPMLLLLR